MFGMSVSEWFARPTNMACHDYCKHKPMPPGLKSLLGKGLKFCIRRPRPSNNYKETMKRFKKDVRRIFMFKEKPPPDEPGLRYIPGLYIKNDNFKPPLANDEVEECLANFEKKLRQRQQPYQNRTSLSNLTYKQWKLSEQMLFDDDHMVVECDKNLGGACLDRPVHNTKGITEHLGNTDVYKRLTKKQAYDLTNHLRYKINVFIAKWKKHISPAEWTYLHEATFKYPSKLARFRMTLKAHKKPWKMRPIVCCAGTLMNCLSKWLDYWLQKLRPHVSTYIKDSNDLINKLKSLGLLPPNAWVFTADANSMYTNIDTAHALLVIGLWLDSIDLPEGFPLEAVKEAMALVMKNNIFEWGDLYFLQLLGTAMGTSAACMWATIYFAVHEMGTIIPKYNDNLLLFCRFIDDIFGIWVGDRCGPRWDEFKKDINTFGMLTWEFVEPSDSVDFLDLTISIERGQIITKTFQKEMNLYQYISPSSNHPPKMINGIIFSLLRTYMRQNTREADYQSVALKLFHRHAARGWNRVLLKDIILKADKKIRHQLKNPPPTLPEACSASSPEDANKELLFLHMEYGQNDLPRKAVREIYDSTCREVFEEMGIKKFVIAYSRSNNIKEVMT